MTIAQQTPAPPARSSASKALRNGRWSGYRHLLMARMREMLREPEVLFWVFGFPLLLALGLGIAFRNKPADVTSIAIVAGPESQNTLALLQSSQQQSLIHAKCSTSRKRGEDFAPVSMIS